MPKKPTKKKDKVEPLKLERVVETVKHNFNDDELISFGYKLGQKYRAIRSVQTEGKAVAADYKGREKSLEADIDEVSGKLNAGFEMRGKPCFKFFDYKAARVYWVLREAVGDPKGFKCPDADALLEHLLIDESFEPVKQRGLREHERQAPLFADAAADDAVVDAEFEDGKPTDKNAFGPDPDADQDGKQAVETS